MTNKLPRLTAGKIIRVLEKLGPKVIKSILKDAGLTAEELEKLL